MFDRNRRKVKKMKYGDKKVRENKGRYCRRRHKVEEKNDG